MKLTNITRFAVASCALVGTVMVATSQPGAGQQGAGDFPEHSMIPQQVSMTQVQEFKDAATLHLNDMLNHQMNGGGAGSQLRGSKTKFNETTIIHTSVFINAINDTIVRYKEWNGRAVGPSTGPMREATPAETAVLKYVFDNGVDMLSRTGTAGGMKGMASPAGISAHITPKDMGMSPEQFKQVMIQYAMEKQGRFWRDAASGLATGK